MEHEFSRILVIQRDRTSKSCGARILQDSSNPKRSHLNGTKKQGARISLKKILRDCHVVCFINCLGHKFSRDQSNPKRLYLSAITCYNCSFQNISYQKVVYQWYSYPVVCSSCCTGFFFCWGYKFVATLATGQRKQGARNDNNPVEISKGWVLFPIGKAWQKCTSTHESLDHCHVTFARGRLNRELFVNLHRIDLEITIWFEDSTSWKS